MSETFNFGEKRIYTKATPASIEDWKWLQDTKGKKTAGARLAEIIKFYKDKNNC